MITAAPVVRKPLKTLGSPGLTDYTKIYIASELNAREYRTTLRHEQAHIWAGHNRRRPKGCDAQLWILAEEMEIARNIYDDDDLITIEAPRSRLKGAILPNTIQGLPANLFLAEDIYEWLLENKPTAPPAESCQCCADSKDDSDAAAEDGRVLTIIEAREALDGAEKEQRSQAAAVTAYQMVARRPPSIVEALDAALRYRVVREPSYSRPSRRPSRNFIVKGRVSTPRPPHVEIFVDRSGSFSPEKTADAENILRLILARYHASIRHDTWFFGNSQLSGTDIPGGGNTPYHLIAAHLRMSSPKIAVIITDDDMAGDVGKVPDLNIICIPIGCTHTQVAKSLGGQDVVIR